jgi:hypothetical protein
VTRGSRRDLSHEAARATRARALGPSKTTRDIELLSYTSCAELARRVSACRSEHRTQPSPPGLELRSPSVRRAWSWRAHGFDAGYDWEADGQAIVVLRFDERGARTRVALPEALRAYAWRDALTGEAVEEDGDALALDLGPWAARVLCRAADHAASTSPRDCLRTRPA